MRAYRLHSASWATIVTQRVQEPEAIADRLATRRRPENLVPSDNQLVLLKCDQLVDPRRDQPVERRELLDRIIEALSIGEVDGVVASADILEELTLLNMLERRIAFCTSGPPVAAITASHFDGVSISDTDPLELAAAAHLHSEQLLPVLANLVVGAPGAQFDTTSEQWITPMNQLTTSVMTGPGFWVSLPAISGLSQIAESAGFPVLMRDTDVPILPASWERFFESELPLTVRGIVMGVSALFPIEGTVAEATATIARAVRSRAVESAPL